MKPVNVHLTLVRYLDLSGDGVFRFKSISTALAIIFI